MLVFDERHAPLICIVGWGDHQASDVDVYLTKFTAWHAAKKRFLVLSDPRAQAVPNAALRRRYAELADTITAEMPGVTVANVAVLGSALLVGAARAVSWLRSREDPTRYCQTAVEGLAWLEERGRAAGLIVPAAARDLAKELDVFARAGKSPQPLVS